MLQCPAQLPLLRLGVVGVSHEQLTFRSLSDSRNINFTTSLVSAARTVCIVAFVQSVCKKTRCSVSVCPPMAPVGINGFPMSPMGRDTRVSHPFKETRLTVLMGYSSQVPLPGCTMSWLHVADIAIQMQYAHASTRGKALLAVTTPGSKLSPSRGWLLAGCLESSQTLWGWLRLSSCRTGHDM